MDITILENGRLRLSVEGQTPEERADLAERTRTIGESQLLGELLEPYSTNGSFTPFDASDANPFVGLTSAPCIAEAMYGPDDEGKQEVEGRLWWFPDYAVRSLVDELVETGTVEFDPTPSYEAKPGTRRGPGR